MVGLDLQDGISLVVSDYELRGNRSIDSLRSRAKHLLRYFGAGLHLDEIRSRDIPLYIRSRREEGARPATINQDLALLGRVFTLAMEQEYVYTRPVIHLLPLDNARTGFVSPELFQQILTRITLFDPDVGHVVESLWILGWRLREITNLKWADVSTALDRICLSPTSTKNKKVRIIPITGRVRAILVQRLALSVRRQQYVFTRRESGLPIRSFYGLWRRTVSELGKPGLLIHDLRRSMVRNATRAGVPEKHTMALGGWRTRSVFDRYQIVAEQDLLNALERKADTERGL